MLRNQSVSDDAILRRVAGRSPWPSRFLAQALACVVGVLVEVPVMLSVRKMCNASRGWYQQRTVTG